MSKSVLLTSSLAKKYWMALTGLFLCLFLVGHLAGNLQLLMPLDLKNYWDSGSAAHKFNAYAKFMTSNPAVKILSYLTYFSIIFHSVDGILLAIANRKARPVRYKMYKGNETGKWTSRQMALLGSVVLLFIVTHMANFWARMHFDSGMPQYILDRATGEEVNDLYRVVIGFFKHPDYGLIWTLVYVVCMIFLALHLSHGFQSAFQSLGIRHKVWTQRIKIIGTIFAFGIPLGFAIIPLYIHFGMDIDQDIIEGFFIKK